MSLTEFEIIEKHFKGLTGSSGATVIGIGDDAAVLDIPTGYQLVTSVDTLVSGIHFFSDCEPYDIGYKSLAVNLSDLAAMSAKPLWVTLSLTLPGSNTDWIKKFATGFSELANFYGVSLVGGDLTHGPLSITVQVMGLVETGRAVTRSGAAVGDDIYVSGALGCAGLALEYYNRKLKTDITPSSGCIERLLRPQPRVALGLELSGLASAAIDISDGLAADLGHVLEQSKTGAIIEIDKLPLSEDLLQIGDLEQRMNIALSSGDDYELCFTVPEGNRENVERKLSNIDVQVKCIGKITDKMNLVWLLPDGTEYKLTTKGYEHFKII